MQTTINEYKLQISLYEIIKIDDLITSSGIQNIKTNVKLLTHEKQYVNSRSTLAQLEIFLPTQGILSSINNNIANSTEILILQDKDIRPFVITQTTTY